jgi:hypothetical protein
MNAPGGLVRYDAMVHAIAECHKVDEVKSIHDKALALELYAKQAMNVEAERKACEVRLRAERRAGEMMADMKRTPKAEAGATGGHAKAKSVAPATVAGPSEYQQARQSAGITERTAQRWQELAAVPAKTFEAALRDQEKKPTTNAILAATKEKPRMDDGALWLWGQLREFERTRLNEREPAQLFNGMTKTMQDDLKRILPTAIDWLTELQECANG